MLGNNKKSNSIKTLSSNSKQLSILVSIVFFGYLGISLPYPALSPMILNNVGNILEYNNDDSFRVIALGILLCAYPLGQFFGATLLGTISDIIGRRHSLILSLIGTALGYSLSAGAVISSKYLLLLFSRLFTGFCEGNIAITQAAAADMCSVIPKSVSFSFINSALAIGYIIGPLIGGWLVWMMNDSIMGYAMPFVAGMIFAMIGLVLTYLFFHETIKNGTSKKANIGKQLILQLSYFSSIFEMFSDKKIRYAILVFLLFYIGIDLFYEFYPLFFVKKWYFNPKEIAIFSAVYTLPYAISQAYLVSKMGKRFTPKSILKYSGSAAGIVLLLLIVPSEYPSLYISLPLLGISISFCSTNTGILVSDASKEEDQGKILGIAQALRVLNIVIITILGGFLGALDFVLPLFSASIFLLLTFFVL